MKLLFDQNISYRLIKLLKIQEIESAHVSEFKLTFASDFEIWNFAKNNNFSIVTKDSDFNDLANLYGFPPKIIWIRCGNINTEEIINLLVNNKQIISEFLNNTESSTLQLYKI